MKGKEDMAMIRGKASKMGEFCIRKHLKPIRRVLSNRSIIGQTLLSSAKIVFFSWEERVEDPSDASPIWKSPQSTILGSYCSSDLPKEQGFQLRGNRA